MPADRLTRLATGLLLGTLLVPLLYVPGFVFPAVVPRTAFFNFVVELGVLALVAALLLRPVESTAGTRRDYVLLAFAALVVIELVTALTGVAPMRSLFGEFERMWSVLTWVHLLLFYVLIRSFMGDRGRELYLRAALVVVAVAGAVMVANNAALDRGIRLLGTGTRNAGVLGNNGFMAALLLFGMAFALLAWRRDPSRGWRRFAAVVGVFAAVLFLYAAKRAALLGVAGGIVAVLGALAAGGAVRTRRAALRVMGAGALLAAGVLASALVAGDSLQTAPTFVAKWSEWSLERSASERLTYWDGAAEAFLDRPLRGWGPENYDVAFGATFEPTDQETLLGMGAYPDRAHNAFLDALAMSGVFGLLAFAGLWAGLGWHLLRGWKRQALSGWEAAVVLGASVAYAVYLCFWFPEINSFPLFLALAAFVVTRVEGPLVRFRPARADAPRRWVPLAAAAAIVALVTWQHGVRPLRAAHAMVAPADAPFQEKLAGFWRAFAIEAPQREDALALYVGLLQAERQRAEEIRQEPARSRLYDRALRIGIGQLAAAQERNPESDYLHALAAGLGDSGYRVLRDPRYADYAADQYRRAIEAAPGRIRYRHLLAGLQMSRGDAEAATATLRATLAVHAGFGETHYFMALARHAAGDLQDSADWMRRSLAMGFRFPGVEPYIGLAESLEAAGQAELAAAIYVAYLAVGAEIARDRTREWTWTEAELRVGNRLAPLYLRMELRDKAAELADGMAAQLPIAAGQYATFAADVRSGLDRGWAELDTLIPDRDLAALRAFRPEGS